MRSATATAPLGAEQLRSYLDRCLTSEGLAHLARCWGQSTEQVDVDRLVDVLLDPGLNQRRHAELSRLDEAILAHLAEVGSSARGETLRRDFLLHGAGDVTRRLQGLVRQGAVLAMPLKTESTIELSHLLDDDTTVLQRELVLTQAMAGELLARPRDAQARGLASFSGEVEPLSAGRPDVLEMNLLHLSSLVMAQGLRLNKSGQLHRRDLARLAEGVIFPHGQSPVASSSQPVDLDDALVVDYLAFLLAVACEVGLCQSSGQSLTAELDGQRAFFLASPAARHRLLLERLQNLRTWSELDSLTISRERSLALAHTQLSQFERRGEGFIGARGYVLSVLRRAKLSGWTPIDALIELCDSLDRGYLSRTLGRTGYDDEPRAFIDAVLRRTLTWAGFVAIGGSDDGMLLARFTEQGQQALGQTDAGARPVGPSPCLIVQPNFEVMVFIDAAPLDLLFALTSVAERISQADRVVTYRMSSESVQRGLAMGYEVEELITALERASHAPIPASVLFELRDWERVHGNVTVHARGYLIRQRDVEQLELHLGQLAHELGEEATILRLDGRSAFVVTEQKTLISRFSSRHRARWLGYDEEQVRPCLHFVDPLTVMIDPLNCDITTARTLERIAEALEDKGPDGSLFFALCPQRIRRQWPEAPLPAVLDFLRPRVEGGLPSEQALRLRAAIDAPPRARIMPTITVVVVDDEKIARQLEDIDEARAMIIESLGERAFAIAAHDQLEFEALLGELGFLCDASPAAKSR
jgi:hypothetical protein